MLGVFTCIHTLFLHILTTLVSILLADIQPHGSTLYTFIDGNDTLQEGEWRSSRTGELLTAQFWDANEPGVNEDCIAINVETGLWHDYGCNAVLTLLCEAVCKLNHKKLVKHMHLVRHLLCFCS